MKLRTEVRDDVFIVTINRPEVRNCIDRETAEALAEAFSGFDADDSLKVAVLTGEGGYFCAGADLKDASYGAEAVAMALVNRWVEPGEALPAAIELAQEIGSFPKLCMRNDRPSVIN